MSWTAVCGAAQPRSFPQLDKDEWGLKPLEMEIWHGFVFVRFQPGLQPAVAEILARFERCCPHDMENLVAVKGSLGSMESAPVNWKSSVMLITKDTTCRWRIRACKTFTARITPMSRCRAEPHVRSVSLMMNLAALVCAALQEMLSLLPEPWASLPRQWIYFGMFPNTVIACYPDAVIFYQDIPLGVGETAACGGIYARLNEDRATRLARQLSMDRQSDCGRRQDAHCLGAGSDSVQCF